MFGNKGRVLGNKEREGCPPQGSIKGNLETVGKGQAGPRETGVREGGELHRDNAVAKDILL